MYKLETETARRLLNGCRDTAEVLRDAIELDKEYLDVRLNPLPDVTFVNEETGEHRVFSSEEFDSVPILVRISKNTDRLAVVEQTINELLDENPELQD